MATRYFAFVPGYTVTFIIDNDGVFEIDAIVRKLAEDPVDVTTLTTTILSVVEKRIKTVKQSVISQQTYQIIENITKIKKAIARIEEAYLSPYTAIGRRRLEKEFELIIDDA
jgi:DhnA family fructose-bisphosphate aldolase class Ia